MPASFKKEELLRNIKNDDTNFPRFQIDAYTLKKKFCNKYKYSIRQNNE